jgi:hypothetical protein
VAKDTTKFIDEDQLKYKANLESLMQSINPKPSAEEREVLRQEYLARRTKHE